MKFRTLFNHSSDTQRFFFLELSLFDAAKGWGFGNPINFLNNPKWSSPDSFPGKYEWLDYEDDEEVWTENYGWSLWEPWYNQY